MSSISPVSGPESSCPSDSVSLADGFKGDVNASSLPLRHRLLTVAADPRDTISRLTDLEEMERLGPWFTEMLNQATVHVRRHDLLHLLLFFVPARFGFGVIDSIVGELESGGHE